jgi:hypothetical protein
MGKLNATAVHPRLEVLPLDGGGRGGEVRRHVAAEAELRGARLLGARLAQLLGAGLVGAPGGVRLVILYAAYRLWSVGVVFDLQNNVVKSGTTLPWRRR